MDKIRIISVLIVLITLDTSISRAESIENTGFLEDFTLSSLGDSKPTSEALLPEGWEKLKFPNINNETSYKVVKENSNFVLKAESKASASGLVKKTSINLKEFPILSWKWKVAGVLKSGDARLKSGDDYPARIYITFAYDPSTTPFWDRVKFKAARMIYGDVPSSAINYIWANKLEKGSHIPNAYTDKVIMFSIESGDNLKGEWISESRNVYEDYKLAFGKEPPIVTSIALMADSDNTGGLSISYYDDISFAPIVSIK